MLFGGVLSIRRIRGCGSAGFIRPQAYAWGYMLAQLRRSPVTHDTAKGNLLIYLE